MQATCDKVQNNKPEIEAFNFVLKGEGALHRRHTDPHLHAICATTALHFAESESSASAAPTPRARAAAWLALQHVHAENCLQKGRSGLRCAGGS